MSSSSPYKKKIMLLIGLFVVIGGFYLLYVYPSIGAEQQRLNRELTRVENRRKLAQERINQIPILEKELIELKEKKGTLLTEKVHKPENFLVNLMAVITGANLDPLSYQPRVYDDGFSINLFLMGGFRSIMELIHILEDLDPRLEISSFQIRSREDELEINLDLFYYTVEGVN